MNHLNYFVLIVILVSFSIFFFCIPQYNWRLCNPILLLTCSVKHENDRLLKLKITFIIIDFHTLTKFFENIYKWLNIYHLQVDILDRYFNTPLSVHLVEKRKIFKCWSQGYLIFLFFIMYPRKWSNDFHLHGNIVVYLFLIRFSCFFPSVQGCNSPRGII